MKKLHIYIIRSFVYPFAATFFVVLFMLLMQFIWKYVDDMVGKGLEAAVITELLLYTSASLVPMALPLAMLLSSIMVFGNLGEHYELVALKSSGLSLQKIMYPLIISAVFISIMAFYFSNHILPAANLKAGSLLWDIREQKPALNIKEGVFYNDIENYSIRIMKKGKDGRSIYDVIIYDHTEGRGNNKVIIAKSGNMQMSDDKRYLVLTLNNGYSYDEAGAYKRDNNTKPHRKMDFGEQVVRFDLTSFVMTRTDEELFKDHEQMLSIRQLEDAEDTIHQRIKEKTSELAAAISSRFFFKRNIKIAEPAEGIKENTAAKSKEPFLTLLKEKDGLSGTEINQVMGIALNQARSIKMLLNSAKNELTRKNKDIIYHRIEWHRKFTLSFACLLLFFIGAPLGAIIRKGGFGMPVVVSVVFFVVYYVISITSEKLVKEASLLPWQGMWTASAIMLPVGIFLTYKAATDAPVLDIYRYTRFFESMIKQKEQPS